MISAQRTDEVLLVSHRGNLTGPGENENSHEALERVIASKFKWVEIDVQITRDEILVLHHDHFITINGQPRNIWELSLSELRAVENLKDILTLDEVLKEYGS